MPSQFIDWAALAAAVIAFAALWYLKRTRTAGFGLRVIIATVLGIALGLVAQGHTQYVGVFGVIWSQVIAALVVPLLLFSVFSSVTNLGDSLRLRGMAVKTVVFLLLNTLTASLLTLGLASAFRIGVGFQFAMPTDYQQREVPGVIDTIINLFPSNLMANWSANQVVPVVLFSLLAAVAYTAVASTDSGRETVKPFKAVIDAGDAVLSKATQIIVGFTPYAVLSLIASAVGDNDILTLLPLLAVFVLKELLMLAGGMFLVLKKKKRPSKAMWYGKLGTVLFYCSFVVIAALKGIWKIEILPLDIALLSVTAVCMLYALYRYAKLFSAVLRSTDPKDSIDLKSDIKAKREPKEAE